MPGKAILLAMVLLVMLTLHVAVLHTMVNVGTWWRLAIVGIALVVAVKVVVISAHARKSKRAKTTSPKILD